MVHKKVSRKKIMSKSSKTRTKKVGGGMFKGVHKKIKGTKKGLSRGVNRVMALGGLGSQKAHARVKSRKIYNEKFKTLLNNKKKEIADLKRGSQNVRTKEQKVSLLTQRYQEKKQLKSQKSFLKGLAAKQYQNSKSNNLFNTKMKLLKKAAKSKKFFKGQSNKAMEFLTKIKEFKFNTASRNDKNMFNRLVENAEKQLKSGIGLGSMRTLREYNRRKKKIEGAKNYIRKHQKILNNQQVNQQGTQQGTPRQKVKINNMHFNVNTINKNLGLTDKQKINFKDYNKFYSTQNTERTAAAEAERVAAEEREAAAARAAAARRATLRRRHSYSGAVNKSVLNLGKQGKNTGIETPA